MRHPLLALLIVATVATSWQTHAQAPQAPAGADPTAAEMTTYYMVLLRRGPTWTSAVTPETQAVSQGHMDNIRRLTTAGTMVVAGPFLEQSGDRALAGLFILRVATADEAKALAESDPAVKARRFTYEILPWLGPRTLRR